jgi:hypothetical protein
MAAPINALRRKSRCELGAVHTWHQCAYPSGSGPVSGHRLVCCSPNRSTCSVRCTAGNVLGRSAICRMHPADDNHRCKLRNYIACKEHRTGDRRHGDFPPLEREWDDQSAMTPAASAPIWGMKAEMKRSLEWGVWARPVRDLPPHHAPCARRRAVWRGRPLPRPKAGHRSAHNCKKQAAVAFPLSEMSAVDTGHVHRNGRSREAHRRGEYVVRGLAHASAGGSVVVEFMLSTNPK